MKHKSTIRGTQKRGAGDGLAARDERHTRVRASGGTPREAVRAYCAGNRWMVENAKGVGNW